MTKPKILLHVPSLDGVMRFESALACLQTGSAQKEFVFTQNSFSTLLWNSVWCKALNGRKEGFTHYAMLHVDLYPTQSNWLDQLLDIMQRHDAEAVAVNIAVKDGRGLSSTCLDTGVDRFSPRRFTMKQLAKMPKTFTHPKLLVNNGMMLVDLSAPWVEKAWYNNENIICKDEHGNFTAQSYGDDWFFARKMIENGARVFATSEIQVMHVGQQKFPNHGEWGSWEIDQQFGKAELGG